MSDTADLFSCLVEELSWEWTATYACAVCLEDTVYMADEVWVDSKTYACS